MPIDVTPSVLRTINVPDLPDDFKTSQQCRLLWEQIGVLQGRLDAAETTNANLVTAANALESELVALKNACAASGIFTET